MINIIPNKFRQMRKQMGLTQVSLGALFGVSDQAIARWEKGFNPIPGSAKILIWLLYDEQINGNKSAVRDYIKQVKL